MFFFSTKRNSTQYRVLKAVVCAFVLTTIFALSMLHSAVAAPNLEINYQGKLTDTTGQAVPDGEYNMRFWLLTSPSVATTSAEWSEELTGTDTVTVTNGLFSVMLGSTSPLTSVDFDQTLYLGVEIGGTGSPSWDGEMSPRKVLGTVPSAFEAQQLGGIATSSFLRSDEADTISANSVSSLLSVDQKGTGDVITLLSDGSEVFTVSSAGNTGLGTTSPSSKLTVAGTTHLGGDLTATGTVQFSAITGGLLSADGSGNVTASSSLSSSYIEDVFLRNDGDTTTGNLVFNDSVKALFGTGSDASIYYDGTDFQFDSREVGTGNFIFNNGNVGINSANPEVAFQIATSSDSGSTIRLENTQGSLTGIETLGSLEFRGNDASGSSAGVLAAMRGISTASGDGKGGLIFETSSNGPGARKEVLRIDEGGRVGLETSSIGSGAKLHIYADTSGFQNDMTVDGENLLILENQRSNSDVSIQFKTWQDEVFSIGTDNSLGGDFTIYDGTDNRLTIQDGTGNVGIGTTSPTALLTIGSSTPGGLTAGEQYNSAYISGSLELDGAFYDSVNNSAGTDGFVLQTTGSGTEWVATSSLGFASAESAHDPVTLAGENYLSLTGQQITANAIDLASSNVTGTLSVDHGGTGATSLSGLLLGNGTSAFTATNTLSSSYIEDVFLRNDQDDTTTGSLTATEFVTTDASATSSFVGDVTIADERGLLFGGLGNTGIKVFQNFNAFGDNDLVFSPNGSSTDFVNLAFPARVSITGNSGLDGSGNFFPSFTIGDDGSVKVVNTTEGAAADRYFEMDFTSGARVTTGGFRVDAGNVGIGTTSPASKLTVQGDAGQTSPLFTVASSTSASLFSISGLATGGLSVDYGAPATTTIQDNEAFAWTIATSTTADPVFRIDTSGTKPTTTISGSLVVDSGSISHNAFSGVTSVDNLELGTLNFVTDAGIVQWVDMPVATTTADLTRSYTAQLDGNSLLTVYGVTDGSGGVTDTAVGIGSTSPSARFVVQGEAGNTNDLFRVASSSGETYVSIGSDGQFVSTSTATSTFRNGLDIDSGCFAVNGTCIDPAAASTLAALTDTAVGGAASGTLLSYDAGTGTWYDRATNTLNIAISDTTGTLAVNRGGTGATSLSGLLLGNGTSAFTATNTLSSSYIEDVFLRNDGDTTTGNLVFTDNTKALFGTGSDASIYYDGTDFQFDSQEVGSGDFIFNNGNVGIGTTSPAARLDIDNSGSDTMPLSITTNGSPGNYAATTTGIFMYDAAGRETLRIHASDPDWQNNNAFNLFVGLKAGADHPTSNVSSTGIWNTGVGAFALASTTSGIQNTGVGVQALFHNTTGDRNTALGSDALQQNSTGQKNVGIGFRSDWRNSTGTANTLVGAYSGAQTFSLNIANYSSSTLLGYRAGEDLRTGGDSNILIGYQAGGNLITGSNNILLGYDIDAQNTDDSNTLNIGNLIFGTGIDGTGTSLSSGNIGIGTTSPWKTLSVAGDLSVTGAFFDSANSSAGTNGFVLQTTGSGTEWVATSSLGINGHDEVTLAGEDYLSLSGQEITANAINPDNLAATDFGDFTCNGTTCSLDADTVSTSEILDGTITEADLNLNAPTDNYILVASSTASGGFEWVATSSARLGLGGGGGAFTSSGGFTTLNSGSDLVGIGSSTPTATLTVQGQSGQTGNLLALASSTGSQFFTVTSDGKVGIGTTSPSSKLTIESSSGSDTLFNVASSTLGSLFAIEASGNIEIDNGAFSYDYSTREVSIENLRLGPMNFDTNAGKVSWIDLVVDSSAATGTVQSYSAQLDSNNILTIYGQADGQGGVDDLRVLIGTSTDTVLGSSNIPNYSMIIGNGILCVDNGADNCDDAARTQGTMYAVNTTVTGIDVAENYPTKQGDLEAAEIVMLDPLEPVFVERYDVQNFEDDLGIVEEGTVAGETVSVDDGVDGTGSSTTESTTPLDTTATSGVPVSNGASGTSGNSGNVPGQGKKIRTNNSTQFTEDRNTPHLLGVVSTKPGLLLGGFAIERFEGVRQVPIALNGRVPVKVTNENGDIKVGDRITPSKTRAGYGMKANSNYNTVGVALEPFTAQGENATSTVLTFVDLESREITETVDLSGDYSSSTLLARDEGYLSALLSFFDSVGVFFGESVTIVRNLVASTFTVGSSAVPSGITLFDEETGEPYCVVVSGGELVHRLGECAPDASADTGTIGDTATDPTQDQNNNGQGNASGGNNGNNGNNGGGSQNGSTTDPVSGNEASSTANGTSTSGQASTTTEEGGGDATTTEPADTTPPEITLQGSTEIELTEGDSYTEPGYTATDDTDGDISDQVTIGGGAVDTSTVGTYTVTYNVSDSAGNAAPEVTRTVTVVAAPEPEPEQSTTTDEAATSTSDTE